jgi:hypothetical protein
MYEPKVIECTALVLDHQTAEVAEPGEEALDLPTAAIASEGTAILGLRVNSSAPMRRNHLDAQVGQRCIQRIRIIGAVSDEAQRHTCYEAGVEGEEGGGDERNLVRRSCGGTDDTDGERKTSTVCHSLAVP